LRSSEIWPRCEGNLRGAPRPGRAALAKERWPKASPCSALLSRRHCAPGMRLPSLLSMSAGVAARTMVPIPVNGKIGRQPEPRLSVISGMKPVGMKRTTLVLAALAALSAVPARAQTDFLTLQENVDASGTTLMCPTRADNYVDCADAGTLPVPSARGGTAHEAQPRRLMAHGGHERHGRREARHRGWQDHLYLRAHGERRHGGGKGDHAGHGRARRHARR
jgi:hypothetical protein